MKLYIGIDNGASGGIAALNADGTVWRAEPMPLTEPDLLQVFLLMAEAGDCFAMLEHAQAFPKMGVSGAFNYGQGYGAMKMALTAGGIGFDIVVPRKWQGALSCLTGGDKNVSKRRAQQLWPHLKITHATADALLIAEYGRRIRTGAVDGKEESRGAQGHTEARPGEEGRGGDEKTAGRRRRPSA